ncbi:guanylate kinase [Rheinheimera sp. WS51]|uniref:guanylate kinase n=1 Tax=Rheinheimera sp. WS51 TaxID=3425886 RepID=UPI003D8A88D4
MQQLSGNLFIISAPSGAGKSSLIQALLKQHNDMQVSISHTTRAPRPGEIDGVHYHFISVDKFKALIKQDAFFEWAEVFGNYYGTSKQAIQQQLEQGIDVFLDIDWQGARQIRQQTQAVTGIFIFPPNLTELKTRLTKRGQDSAEVIAKRMAEAYSEMSHANEYEYLIINDNFAQAEQEFKQIVLAQRNSFQSQLSKHHSLVTELLANPTK